MSLFHKPIIIHCQNLKLKIRKYSMETLRGNSTQHRVSKLPRVAYVAALDYPEAEQEEKRKGAKLNEIF
jgi:hypothetical protein